MTGVIALTPRRPALTVAVLGLLAGSLALLALGHFFSWNDVEGSQYTSWNYGMGDLAGLGASVAVVVSLFDRAARRLCGAVVGAVAVGLVVAGAVAPAFSFVGSEGLGGALAWGIPLAMAAFVLLTPRWRRTSWGSGRGWWRLTGWGRCSLYLLLFFPTAWACFAVALAITTAGHRECGEPGDACLEAYDGWFLGAAAVAVVVLVVVVAELAALVRRLRRRHARRL